MSCWNFVIPSCRFLTSGRYDLASNNIRTYEDIGVTCATRRVKCGQPFISTQPNNILSRVKKDLGEMPLITATSMHDFVFWAAALVNPVPALGVSLDTLEGECWRRIGYLIN